MTAGCFVSLSLSWKQKWDEPLSRMRLQDVPVALGSSGKTIKSKANDRVFVYYR